MRLCVCNVWIVSTLFAQARLPVPVYSVNKMLKETPEHFYYIVDSRNLDFAYLE